MDGSKRDERDWLQMLKRSFDQLDHDLQQAFLDAAMLWRGRHWQEAADYLDEVSLQSLVDHSLVTVNSRHHASLLQAKKVDFPRHKARNLYDNSCSLQIAQQISSYNTLTLGHWSFLSNAQHELQPILLLHITLP